MGWNDISFQVDAMNNNGDTPLHYAARKGWLDIIDLLAVHEANLKAKGSFGSIKHVAKEHHQVIKILEELNFYIFKILMKFTHFQ